MKKKIFSLFDQKKPEFRISNASDGATEIFLYDTIGSWYGIQSQDVVSALHGAKGAVTMHINSPGGDVFEARAIATAINQHGNVTAQIDGVAASAASYIALAAKQVNMADGAFLMIHRGWTVAAGNAVDLAQTVDLLNKVDQSIANDYMKKTGKPRDEIMALMDAETWFTAQEAKAAGFIDSIIAGDSVENRWDFGAYRNAPKALLEAQQSNLDLEAADRMRRVQMLARIA